MTFPFLHPGLAAIALATGLIPILVHLINRRRYVRVPWAAMSFLLAARRRSAKRVWLEQFLLLATRIALIVLFGLAVARPFLPASSLSSLKSARTHRVLLIDNSLSMNARIPSTTPALAPLTNPPREKSTLPRRQSSAQAGSPSGLATPTPARSAGEVTRFDLAQQYILRLLDAFPPTDAVSVVTLVDPDHPPVAQPSFDRRFVRDQVAAIEPTQRSADTVGALKAALRILRDSHFPPANRAVYLISDLPRNVWQAGKTHDSNQSRDRLPFTRSVKGNGAVGPVRNRPPQADAGAVKVKRTSYAPPVGAVVALRQLADELHNPGVDVTVLSVAGCGDGQSRHCAQNVGISRLTTLSPLVAVHQPVRIVAELTNYGQAPARNVTLQFRSDGRTIRRHALPVIRPGTTSPVTVTTIFTNTGTHLVEAKLSLSSRDVLPDDDVRYLSVEVRNAIPVLVVDGRPGRTTLTGQAGFLVTALAPPLRGANAGIPGEPTLATDATHSVPSVDRTGRPEDRGTLIEPKIITEPELAAESLADYAVVVLCNVRRLPQPSWTQLRSFVAAGGGLEVFCGGLVNVDHYNRLGYAGGRGVLPVALGQPRPPRVNTEVKNSHTPGAAPSGADPDPSTIGRTAPKDDGGEASVGFKLGDSVHPMVAEFAGHPESGLFAARVDRYSPVELDENRGEVVLFYSNGEPAVVASKLDRGRVLLWTTTANMDWNNLPAKGDFVSVMLNGIAFLTPRSGEQRNVFVGQSIQERLTPVQSALPLRVTTGVGTVETPALVPAGDALALVYGPVERASALRVSIGAEALTFAVNTDPAESDLRPVDRREFVEGVDRPLNLVTDPAGEVDEPSTARSTELASWGLYGVLGLLLIELWMAMRFGRQSRVAPSDSLPYSRGSVQSRGSPDSVVAPRIRVRGPSGRSLHGGDGQ